MYIVLAVIIFGILIAVHELGHFITAKLCGVKVNEFSLGMGPQILKKQGKETVYSLRALPIGVFGAMEGEDEESDNPRAFTNQNRIKKLLILVAGAFNNLIFGLIIAAIVVFSTPYEFFVTGTVNELADGFPQNGENCIMAGDTIYSINGMRIYYSSDFQTAMAIAGDRVNVTLLRDGKKVNLSNYELIKREYYDDGVPTMRYGITFRTAEADFTEKVKYTFYTTYDFARLVWMSLREMVAGRVKLTEMSGVVGIVSTINEVGKSAPTVKDGLLNVGYLTALIAVNLAVMNMLPLPALDGGRVFFLLVTLVYKLIKKKEPDPKYEGYIHTAGMILLFALMAVILVSDVVRILNG